MAADMQKLVERLEKVVGRLELVSQSGFQGSAGGDASPAGSAPYVLAFDSLLDGAIAQYLKISKEIGGDVATQAEMVQAGMKHMRGILVTASNCQQPAEHDLLVVLKPLSDQIKAIQDFREKNRGSKLFNHLSAVSESALALGWVTMAPKPGPYVKEMNDAATFYTNRVLKEYKDVDKKHVDWAKAYLNIWTELQAYIKEHHTTGLAWSKTGPKPSGVAMCPIALRAGAPPPPGPPPPPPPPASAAPDTGSVPRSELFAQINQGEGITHALKHVPDDLKTHKNPGLKAQGGAVRSGPKPFITPKPGAAASTPTKTVAKKEPAMLELDGKKWRVENQENASNLVISDTELRQVVYIYKCVNSTLQIKGKINSITVDNCKKLGLVFDHAVGIVEVINCRDVKVQVMGKVPTVSINKTDGCHVYLSKDSLTCEIVSAKSSEMNILVPTSSGDFNEFPVPEQFKTVWNGQKLVTTMTEIAG